MVEEFRRLGTVQMCAEHFHAQPLQSTTACQLKTTLFDLYRMARPPTDLGFTQKRGHHSLSNDDDAAA